MGHIRRLIVLTFAALFAFQTCLAQPDPWDRVQLIAKGKKVSVTLFSGKKVNGKMLAWTQESVSVTRGAAKTVEIPKADVKQVVMVIGKSRLAKAAWAFAIGGGAGAATIGGLCAKDDMCDVNAGAVALGSAVIIGGISAGIAGLFPAHREVIYAAPPR